MLGIVQYSTIAYAVIKQKSIRRLLQRLFIELAFVLLLILFQNYILACISVPISLINQRLFEVLEEQSVQYNNQMIMRTACTLYCIV